MRCTVFPHLTEYDERLLQARSEAYSLSGAELAKLPLDVCVEALVDEFAASPVTLHLDQASLDLRDARIGYQEVQMTIPVSGCARAIAEVEPMPFPFQLIPNDGSYKIVTVVRELNLFSPEASLLDLESAVDELRTGLRSVEESANREINKIRDRMRRHVEDIISPKRRGYLAFHDVASDLGIPIGPRAVSERIDLRPRKITLRQLQDAVGSGEKEWHLEERIAEDIVATIMSFNLALERLIVTADKLAEEDEQTLRDLLLFILNANYDGMATGETFVRYGKTDILLRWKGRDAFIGECKFWDGPEHFGPAISQLLDKYTVWRDTRVALIVFIRNRTGIGTIIEKAHECIAGFDRTLQTLTPDEPSRRRDYLVRAANDDERIIRLSLLPVVIPRPPKSEAGRKSA